MWKPETSYQLIRLTVGNKHSYGSGAGEDVAPCPLLAGEGMLFFFLRDAVFLDASCHPVGWNARFATKIKSIDTGLYLLCAKKKKCTVFLHLSTHRQVSLSWRPSEAVKHCSQSTEPFSSFLRDSSSALPLVREYFSSLLMCLLRKAKPEIQRKKESVLNPSVRPRYNILQKKNQKNKKTTENMLIWGVQEVALHLSS